ncbi:MULTISPECIES: hypothetical protein [unclassified Janthinobacterium]|uniref:hypothetical protein n=1 Tax=unclassified Janthinobacterium TaxID=2610881 RepID=UPI001609D3AB|nr:MULTISPECIES: hypothetical protein [unclassified Janthinobacterium]MBB5607974.1 hypothetical protein [Janthinobacterium sp. S3T4]MBB5613285.1 hypothetical protein [Janthinobacterium sp. S3M3]
MNYRTPFTVLMACAMLVACSDKTAATADVAAAAPAPAAETEAVSAPAPAPTAPANEDRNEVVKSDIDRAREAEFMRAVFGKDYRADSDDALADLSDPEQHVDKLSYVVSAVASKLLGNGRAVLVANAETANTEGTAESAHVTQGLLNVFFLTQAGEGKWKVSERVENIAALGSSGQLGDVQWTRLGQDKLGLAIRHGYTGQGYTINQLALFEVGDGEVTLLTQGIDLHSDNLGACTEEMEECWDVSGNWRFATAQGGGKHDDLLIDFSGFTEKIKAGVKLKPDQDPPRTSTLITAQARYVFDGKTYKLAEGRNPVPGV